MAQCDGFSSMVVECRLRDGTRLRVVQASWMETAVAVYADAGNDSYLQVSRLTAYSSAQDAS